MNRAFKATRYASVLIGACLLLSFVMTSIEALGLAPGLHNSERGLPGRSSLADSSVRALQSRARDFRSAGDLDSAQAAYEDALELFPSVESLWQAQVHFELGQVYDLQGHQQEAIEAMQLAMEHFRALESDSGEAVVNEAVAIMHWKQQKPELALEGLLKSLDFKKSKNDSAGIGRSYIMIGNMYAHQERFEAAADYFRLSAGIWQTLKHPKSTVNYSISLNNLGNVYSALGRYADAEASYLKSISIKSEIGDSLGLADAYNNVGDFYFQNEEFEKALTFFNQSAQWLGSKAARPKQVVALENQSITLEKLGQYEDALNVLWKRNELSEALLEDKYSEKVAELLEEFEAEKKDHEITELKAENQLKMMALDQARTRSFIWLMGSVFLVAFLLLALLAIRQHKRKNVLLNHKNEQITEQRQQVVRKNAELEQITATKDRLFSIIAHNLKGPLSALEGVSGVMNYYQKTNQTQRLENVVSEIDRTAFHTNALIDNLLNWARVETQNIPYQPKELDARGVLSQCIELVRVQANMKDIGIELALHGDVVLLADLNFLKTIMTNLLHNAIKFTPNGGYVKVLTNETEGRIRIEVKDSGVGIKANQMEALFMASATKSTSGTNGEKGTGLGLFVCYDFVEKEGGKLQVRSVPGKGSTFSFTLAQAIQEETL